ncbi:arylacetamide deacetylase-like [Lissotriton helveticus]
MPSKLFYFAVASVLVGYYFYIPLPENVEERWKIMFIDSTIRTMVHLVDFFEMTGISHYVDIMAILMSYGKAQPKSDENVTVTEETFNKVPVWLYVPKKPSNTRRRAVIYIHGGGWCSGNPHSYDFLTRQMADRLNAIVVSVDYRLAPAHPFPAAFEDAYAAAKFFLQKEVVDQYNVDPGRICVSGDSAGGNLAAAVTQQLQEDIEVKFKPKMQALVYPALQTIDLDTPSYRDNSNLAFLRRWDMVKMWSNYFVIDKSLREAMESNTHITLESNNLLKFANWSNLLTDDLKSDHVYNSPPKGKSEFLKRYPVITDPRAAPLLVDDDRLNNLPLTYVLTCMYDVLRDDGFMYVARLKQAGVQVVHDHYDNAFHGMLSLGTWPVDLDLSLATIMVNNYINWLNKNL